MLLPCLQKFNVDENYPLCYLSVELISQNLARIFLGCTNSNLHNHWLEFPSIPTSYRSRHNRHSRRRSNRITWLCRRHTCLGLQTKHRRRLPTPRICPARLSPTTTTTAAAIPPSANSILPTAARHILPTSTASSTGPSTTDNQNLP